MEKETFSTFTSSLHAAERDDQGWGDRVCLQCSRKSLQDTLQEAWNASGSGCHEGQASPGGQYSVPVQLSWSHGCWVAIILSSWSSKGCGRSPGGVGSWSGFLHGKIAQPGDSFVSWGSEASSGSLCVEPGVKSNVTRGIQDLTLLWGGAGARDVTLGSSHQWMRVAWAGTDCGMTPKSVGQGLL